MKFSKATICITGLLGATLLIFPVIVAGYQVHNYNPLVDLIGHGMSDEQLFSHLLRYGFQVPAGIFLIFFFRTIEQLFYAELLLSFGFRSLSYFFGMSTILNALFPCDAGCAELTFGLSVSQGMHLMIEGLTYFFIPLILLILGLGFRRINALFMSQFSNWSGIFSIILIVILYYDQTFAGLLQRLIKLTFIVYTLVTVYVCYTNRPFTATKTNFN